MCVKKWSGAPEKQPAESLLDEEDEGNVDADEYAVDHNVAEHEATYRLVVGEYHVSKGQQLVQRRCGGAEAAYS